MYGQTYHCHILYLQALLQQREALRKVGLAMPDTNSMNSLLGQLTAYAFSEVALQLVEIRSC